jgi:hypothetical protein
MQYERARARLRRRFGPGSAVREKSRLRAYSASGRARRGAPGGRATAAPAEAALQQRHEVEHGRHGLLLVLRRRLVHRAGASGADLAPDELHDVRMIRVLVAGGRPGRAHALDQLPGHGQLALRHARAAVGRQRHGRGVGQLVRPAQQHQRQQRAARGERREVLARAQHHRGDAHLARGLQRGVQQGVGAIAARPRRQHVVGLLEIDRVDGRCVHEVHDVDRARGFHVHAAQLGLVQQHEVALVVLVALDDLGPRHLLAGGLVHAQVADGRAVAAVHQREMQLLGAALGAAQRDRDLDQAEGDVTLPVGAAARRLLAARGAAAGGGTATVTGGTAGRCATRAHGWTSGGEPPTC